ncbi:MAG: hypothetical protein HY282_11395 [Nitrospirae bacterium]|nr:hypothetical protein [Candidatus Manganitrophaceae bacterium]
MTPLATLFWALNLLFDTVGQLSFKEASVRRGDREGIAGWRQMLSARWIWIGIFSFAAEFLLWLAFLSLVPLSLAILVGSVNILTVMIGGRIFFGEALTPRRIGAALLIATGMIFVGWG